MPGILILKLVLVPSLIVAITLAGRKWGAGIAGCLAGFPVVTGPILLFLAAEQGVPFARLAAVGATIAVLGNLAFGIAYSWISRRYSWRVSLVGGLVVYFCMVAMLNLLTFLPWQAAAVTFAGLLLAPALYPAEGIDEIVPTAAASDLGHRVTAALGLVLGVTLFSAELGPNLSGLFSVFPVMASVLAVFSHRNVGQRFAARLLRGMVRGFYAFTAFCFLLASTLEIQPAWLSFLYALTAAVVLQAILMHWHQRKLRVSA